MNNLKAFIITVETPKSLHEFIQKSEFFWNPVREFRKFKTVDDLLKDARENGAKNDYHIYNYYSNELSKFILPSSDYEQAIRKLSQILKV